jgi:hypothetical protein
LASDFRSIDFILNGELTPMKSRIFAALTLVGVALSPAFAQAADGCLGSETIKSFKAFKDGSIVVTRNDGGDYRLTFAQKPANMPLTEKIRTTSSGECLAAGDDVQMSGVGGYRAKYKVASVESLSGESTAEAPSE